MMPGDAEDPGSFSATRPVRPSSKMDVGVFTNDLGEYHWLITTQRMVAGGAPCTLQDARRALQFVYRWILRWQTFDARYPREGWQEHFDSQVPPTSGSRRSSTLCANAISSDVRPGTRASTIAAAICDGVAVICGLGKSSNEATSALARLAKGASAFILALVAGFGSGAGISSPHLAQAPAGPVSPQPEHSPPANIRLSWNFPGVSSCAAPHASQTSPLVSFSAPHALQRKKRSVVSSGICLV